MRVIHGFDAMVADSDLVRVAAQILHHRFGFVDIGFAIHYPLALHQLIKLDFHLGGVEPFQLPVLPGMAQGADHGAAKMPGQRFNWKQVGASRRMPVLLIGR